LHKDWTSTGAENFSTNERSNHDRSLFTQNLTRQK
jgi:hypothetical protein